MESGAAAAEDCAGAACRRDRRGVAQRRRGCVSRRHRPGMAGALARQSEGARARAFRAGSVAGQGNAMSQSVLLQLVTELAAGRVRIVDLTQTLSPAFPQIVLPPEMGQAWPFRIEEVSRYDDRGPGWYWNNFSCSEHTGTHFDAPVHWISGKDLPHGSVDTIPAQHFIAPAYVVDCSAQAAADPDYLLSVADLAAFEAAHG